MGYLLAVVGSDAVTAAAAGEPLTLSQIVGYLVAALLGGGAMWKVLLILMARLSVAMAGAKSERDAIERLETQLAVERQAAEVARASANEAYKQRNELYLELGKFRGQVEALTERAEYQAQIIADLKSQLNALKEEIRGKTA